MEETAVSGDAPEPNEVPLTEAAQILFGEDDPEREGDGDGPESSDQDQDAARGATDEEGGGDAELEGAESEDSPAEFDSTMYALEVPLGDELGKVTIGELKDYYQQGQGREADIEAKQATNDTQAQELVQARQELSAMVQLLGPNVSPELVNKVEQDRQQTVSRETLLMLKARPEWRDNARYEADRAELESFVQQFGVGQAEFRSVTDHRLVLMVDQARKDRAALDEAKAKLGQLRKAKTPPKTDRSARGKNGRYQGKGKRKVQTGRDGQQSAVADILDSAGIFKE